MTKRQAFYKSKAWEKFRKIIIDERTESDGFVRCAICGQPIVKKYDLILHHKEELTEDNVDDVNVSLNPDNVECIHFKCHNKEHKRFGFYGQVVKKVFIVYGAPCSGKTTWVKENATKRDLIVDMDSLYTAVNICDIYEKPRAITSVVFDLRDYLIDKIKVRSGKWENAYIIGGYPLEAERQRLSERVNADRVILIESTEAECLQRVEESGRPQEWKEYVKEWFSLQPPPPGVAKYKGLGGLQGRRQFSPNLNF